MKFGWLKDPEDKRDYLFSAHFMPAIALPPKVDLRNEMSAVEDQGQLGSCTAQALVAGAERLWKKHGKMVNGSRLWLYYKEREMRGWQNSDTGANIRDGIKVMASQGLPPETMWPYRISKFAVKPPADVDLQAKQAVISKYYRLKTNEEIKSALAKGFTVTFGVPVYGSFYMPDRGIIAMPKKGEREEGGHAMHIVGYDDSTQMFIVRNSWGSRWAVRGYCYMPYAYMALADDMWCFEVIRDQLTQH